MKKIMAIALAAMLVIGCSFSAWADAVTPDPNTGTILTIDAGDTLKENASNGTIGNPNDASTGNKGTVNSNSGIIYKNHETGTVNTNTNQIQMNIGKVETNDGTIINNHNGGFVETNNKQIDKNWGQATVVTNATGGTITTNSGTVTTNNGTVTTSYGTVTTNNGIVTDNTGYSGQEGRVDGEITTNNGTVSGNSAIVEINTLKGEVTMNGQYGVVKHNYGTVYNAKTASGEKVSGYVTNGTTYYGVTYGEDPTDTTLKVYSNTQSESTITEIKVLTADQAGASNSGYKFLYWKANKSDGSTDATTYVGGETYTISMPVWFEAIWEKLPEETKKAIATGGGGTWSSKPTTHGSFSAPITTGAWKKNTDGTFTLSMNGDKLLNSKAWVTYTGTDGKQYTGCFYFDKNGVMATGWKQLGDEWYYFDETEGNTKGMMKVNTTTPDGYQVDANGKWIQDAKNVSSTQNSWRIGADGSFEEVEEEDKKKTPTWRINSDGSVEINS